MKLKNIAILIAAFAASQMTYAASDSVKVNIKGEVVANSCTVTEEASGASVDFGRVSVDDFGADAGAVGSTQDFALHLTDCGADTTSVTVSASGTADDNMADAFANEATDGAKNVAVTIFGGNDTNTQLKPTEGTVDYALSPSTDTNELPFKAKLIRDSKDAIGTGSETSVVTLKLVYN